MNTIIVPAYNEASALPGLLHSIAQDCPDWRVIVVDDGSTDGTSAVAEEHGEGLDLLILRRRQNSGLGGSLRHGLRAVLSDADPRGLVAVLEADNTERPSMIPMMAKVLYRRGVDVVIASRYQPGSKVVGLPLYRRITSWGAGTLMRLVYATPNVKDYTMALRVYRVKTLQEASRYYQGRLIRESGFSCMAELIAKLGHVGARITEVPMTLRFDLKEGRSKMQLWRTIRRYLWLLTHKRVVLGIRDA